MLIKIIYLVFIVLVIRLVVKMMTNSNTPSEKTKNDDAIDAEYTVLEDEKRS